MPFDGSKLDDVTKLLIEGRERIEQGWCQDVFRYGGSVCMLGALGFGGTLQPETCSTAVSAAQRLARAAGVIVWERVSSFNDRPGRTKDEVLAAFDKAIAQIT